ncbi:hypothetical protein AM500_19885 [Bacillus sp. FJAT-18017]|uniref:S41 family peptidase n=1 Tax=Bacillus sp. FJAT-18017 TaxID=1705566 RepID=UPI0006AF955F|nr:S41 family peptidase [Bacillus sp. FJAT-18017]ALC91792.1 hypothetical protein AM500_19885 [Bacillus sp. FJAT-18017]
MYRSIFEEIVSITNNDYAGCLDKKGWDNPDSYRNILAALEERNKLLPERFADLVSDYLLDFMDSHMYFKLVHSKENKVYDNGFRVRRYQDRLYVTEVWAEGGLEAGDAIIALDGMPVPHLVEKHKRELMTDVAEREHWRQVVKNYSICHVLDTCGRLKEVELHRYEVQPLRPEFSVEVLDKDTVLMTLPDFSDLHAIGKLIHQHEAQLASIPNLLIDVRRNSGGSDSAFAELVPYLFEEGGITIELDSYRMKYNCTERNYNLTSQFMNGFLQEVRDERLKQKFSDFMIAFSKNRGNGFVDLNGELPTVTFSGKNYPKNIIVLSDTYTASAGEMFVDLCKISSKVTVIGRPTAGVNDYANLVIQEWKGLFELWYPTSRMESIDKGNGTSGKGIAPDIYIPWTPEHTKEDVDLKMALSMLRNGYKVPR